MGSSHPFPALKSTTNARDWRSSSSAARVQWTAFPSRTRCQTRRRAAPFWRSVRSLSRRIAKACARASAESVGDSLRRWGQQRWGRALCPPSDDPRPETEQRSTEQRSFEGRAASPSSDRPSGVGGRASEPRGRAPREPVLPVNESPLRERSRSSKALERSLAPPQSRQLRARALFSNAQTKQTQAASPLSASESRRSTKRCSSGGRLSEPS